jgi:hypothetical protein
MPGGYGLYCGTELERGLDLTSSADTASGTLEIPRTAARPAVMNADVRRRTPTTRTDWPGIEDSLAITTEYLGGQAL